MVLEDGMASHPMSNVQFGEGGAGTFTELYTVRIATAETGRCWSLLPFRSEGEQPPRGKAARVAMSGRAPVAGREYEQIRMRLGEDKVHFQSCVTDGEISGGAISAVTVNGYICEYLPVLVIGHSARDTMAFGKGFHGGEGICRRTQSGNIPQSMINESQYGCEKLVLGAA